MPDPDTSNGLPVSGGSEKMAATVVQGTGMVTHRVWSPHQRKREEKLPIREATKNLTERLKIIVLGIGKAAGMVTHQVWSPLKRKKEG